MIINDNFRIAATRATERAKTSGERTGQALFNDLPFPLSGIVAGTSFDPFHKDMSFMEMVQWLDNHLIIDDNGKILAVFHGERILWEDEVL